jgi:zinc protease
LENVKKHLEEYFCPDGAVVAVAGDFEINNFRSQLVSRLEEWRALKKGKPCVAEPIKTCGKVIRLIDKPDLTQTSLIIGHEAPGELSPYKNEIALANYIFGAGNFSSRLMTRIRSSGGKTYGISSQISSEREFGAFTISTSTQNTQLGEVIQGVLDEYRRFHSEGITDNELERAKQFAIGNLAFQLEGIGNVAEKLLWLRFYGRSTSYIENFENMVGAVTKESVNTVIKETFFPDNLIFVAVGRKNETLAALKAIGPVKEYHFRNRI